MKDKAYLVFRELHFSDGSSARIAGRIFTDAQDAQKAADSQAKSLQSMAQPVVAALKFIGIENISHGALEIPVVHGAGLVVPTASLVMP